MFKFLLAVTLTLVVGLASKETKTGSAKIDPQPQIQQCCCKVGTNGKIHCATVVGACSLRAVCYEEESERSIPPTELDLKKEAEYNSKFKM